MFNVQPTGTVISRRERERQTDRGRGEGRETEIKREGGGRFGGGADIEYR